MNNIEKIRRPFFFRIFKKPFFGRYQVEWRWPSDYHTRGTWERVNFASGTRSVIRGLYGKSLIADPLGTIVCCHPMGAFAKGFFLKNGIADRFRAEGFNVLLFDFNGFGESTDGDFYLYKDILAAGLFAENISSGLPVGLYGISFGAAMAICSFSKDENPYKAALLESPFTTLREYWSQFPIPSMVLKTGSTLLPHVERRVRPIVHVSKIRNTKNILWVYSDTDRDTPLEMGLRLKEACNVSSELLVIPGAKHAYCYDQDRERFFNTANSFFKTYLKATS